MTHDPADTGNRALAQSYSSMRNPALAAANAHVRRALCGDEGPEQPTLKRDPAEQPPNIVAEADAPEYLLNALRSATPAQLAHALRAVGASPDRGGYIEIMFGLDEPQFKVSQTYGNRETGLGATFDEALRRAQL